MTAEFDVADEELFQMLQAAFVRGYRWAKENPSPADQAYVPKASYDYADKTTSQLPRIVTGEPRP